MRLVRLLLWTILIGTAAGAGAQDGASQLRSEVSRLHREAAAQPSDNAVWKDVGPLVTMSLAKADSALTAGRVYLATEELGRAQVMFGAYASSRQDPAVLKRGMEGFEEAWKERAVKLAAFDKDNEAKSWGDAPVIVRALGEASAGRVMPTLEASRAYASVTDAGTGYYYLGEASADAEFSNFAHSLKLQRKGEPPALHSILPQIVELQKRINAEFVPPQSIEKHPEFIRLNSTLKVASELDAAKLYAGALHYYLSSVQQLAMLDAAAPDEEKQAEVRNALADARVKVMSSKRDDSIAQLYVERAEAAVGGSPTGEDWKAAAAIVDSVLPAYYGAIAAARPIQQVAGNLVTVTLVRWPYT